MKRLWLAILLIISVAALGGAHAAEALPGEAELLLLADDPNAEIITWTQCGDVIAAVVRRGEENALCIAERNGAAWSLTVNNPNALRQGMEQQPSLLLDDYQTLYWTYLMPDTKIVYHAERSGTAREWRFSDVWVYKTTSGPQGEFEARGVDYSLRNELIYEVEVSDANGNPLDYDEYVPVPASWLFEQAALSCFDWKVFPSPEPVWKGGWLEKSYLRKSAQELFPSYTFVGGSARKDALEFLMKRPDGELVEIIGFQDSSKAWKSVESAPLPADTAYGHENFTDYLYIDSLKMCVQCSYFPDSQTVGISYIHCNGTDQQGTEYDVQPGSNWMKVWSIREDNTFFGTHPWNDITRIDWNALPRTAEELLASLSVENWAMVNNPNPEDRLHLRTKPERGAESLGKYYNGTPVEVLKQQGDWTKVRVLGVEGWMMTKYLAFGQEMENVQKVWHSRLPRSRVDIYEKPSQNATMLSGFYTEYNTMFLVRGVIGDRWYHVWIPDTGLSGYVLQSECWEGNG